MSTAVQFYVSSIAILTCINFIAVWGLDLQYGVAGIYNFAYIVPQAAGAYTAGVLALQPASFYQAGETYIGGLNLGFPLPIIGAALAGGVVSLLMGMIGMRRLRGDYQAMSMLVIALIANAFVTAQTGFFNGPTGISLIPKPLQAQFGYSLVSYQWDYLGLVVVVAFLVFLLIRNVTRSPFGRMLRATRDSESAAEALGRNTSRARMVAMVLGGMLAGLSGGLLVQYIGAWAPGSWLYPETFLFFTAIIVGGTGNMLGNVIGVLLIPTGIIEGTRYLPQIGYPGLTDALDWVIIGLVMLAFMWFRPRGLVPERRRKRALRGGAVRDQDAQLRTQLQGHEAGV
ncbi:MAG TPA: branched-chain amino acid ABC transporter permease [Solirubrobacteraceae bacterium]|jgi:branched-chain amino acid transport system permease protein|nr:branched-chain amino acid ABC transporter permease [Solirubrobacteraceae bacterium]